MPVQAIVRSIGWQRPDVEGVTGMVVPELEVAGARAQQAPVSEIRRPRPEWADEKTIA